MAYARAFSMFYIARAQAIRRQKRRLRLPFSLFLTFPRVPRRTIKNAPRATRAPRALKTTGKAKNLRTTVRVVRVPRRPISKTAMRLRIMDFDFTKEQTNEQIRKQRVFEEFKDIFEKVRVVEGISLNWALKTK
jgi:hypothetical protein